VNNQFSGIDTLQAVLSNSSQFHCLIVRWSTKARPWEGYAVNIGLSDLLGGALGALIIFVLTVLHSGWVSWQQRVRQRTGLLRLLDTEIERNTASIRTIFSGPADPQDPTVIFLITTDEWQACRVEISQLVPIRVFDVIRRYYELVNQVQNVMAPDHFSPEIQESRGPDQAGPTAQLPQSGRF